MKRLAPASRFPVGAVTAATAAVGLPIPRYSPPSVTLPLAHQGGWDEILLVVAPLAIIGALLWMANRRVSAQIAAAERDSDPSVNKPADSQVAADKPKTSDGNGGHGGA